MKMKAIAACALAALCLATFAQGERGRRRPNGGRERPAMDGEGGGARTHRFSTTVERERPQLNEETKRLIAAYRRDPSEANRAALRKQVEANYEKVLERKKAKLEELKRTARHQSKVKEMQDIVDEMIKGRERRIDQTMARFTDGRFRPGLRDEVSPYKILIGASERVSIAYTPVTNEEFAKFTGKAVAPGAERLPVTGISYAGALKYCEWLNERDPAHIYRLPTEEEWELAAGHMPKDADFNCGVGNSVLPVDAYKDTKGACGGIDFWGNCWEWTSTMQEGGNIVKGGAYDSKRTDCRTEVHSEVRKPSTGYPNVTIRLIREDKAERRPERQMDRQAERRQRRQGGRGRRPQKVD